MTTRVDAVLYRVDLMAELNEAIRTQINIGFYDPDELAEALIRCYGEDWVYERVDAFFDRSEVLRREIARQLSGHRRQADVDTAAQARIRRDREERKLANSEITVRNQAWLGDRITAAVAEFEVRVVDEFLTDLLVPQALPGGGWKRRYDLTAADCVALSARYEKRAVTETGMAFAFAKFAAAIEGQGVSILGEVDARALSADLDSSTVESAAPKEDE